ncbi:MAG: hypothetical protein ABSD75_27865 [Terriglobales bacterium]
MANQSSSNVTVIDGTTNTLQSVGAATGPLAVAVNLVTNKIYVANSDSNSITVIDGASNATQTVPTGAFPMAAAVNLITNKIYVANDSSTNVTVIDGATNSTGQLCDLSRFPACIAKETHFPHTAAATSDELIG